MNFFNSKLLGARIYPGYGQLFFYGGIFSQWYQAWFWSHLLSADVSSAEEAMMLYKAQYFEDEETFELIRLASGNPKEQKRLGRLVKNYDESRWAEVRFSAVVENNYDKFSQNEDLKQLILLSPPYLIEASPTDRIWGIGMGLDNPNLLDKKLWGKNLLGKAIEDARVLILDDEFKNRKDKYETI